MLSLQAKVGAFSIAGIIMLLGMVFGLSDIKLGNSDHYRLSVNFHQVIGLKPQAAVCYAGINVGSVESIDLAGDHAQVNMLIDSKVKIPRQSKFSITADGVMGENFVNIQPLENADMTDTFAEGEVAAGSEAGSMANVMEGVSKTLDQVQELLNSMNMLIGDKQFRADIHDMATNMKNVTANLEAMTATLSNMAVNSQRDIEQMAHNLNMMTASLTRSANAVEQMVNQFNGDGETAENLKQSIRNLTATSARIEKMAASLEGVVTDPQVADDLKATLHNARSVSERADKMMATVDSIEVKPGLESMYSGGSHDDKWRTDLDLKFSMGEDKDNKYLKLGLEDIGENNRVDAVAGMRHGSIGAHAGVIESKAGLGADMYLGDRVSLSVDGYDPNDFRLKSRLSYEVMPDTFVFTQVNDINKSDKRTTYVGLRREF